MYLAIKHLHLLCVAVSGLGFLARGVLRLNDSPWLARPWVRIAPHVNDTVLLVAGLALAALSGQYPFVDAWLTAKVLGLLAYIALGTLALGRARTRRGQFASFIAALLVFVWMASVARLRDPAGFLVFLFA
ncbi:MAG: regulator SirB [Betaproteobacteria bacterium HGW-Betaproteobacteria-11]|nr:MAG: regulator SirB [Betaproteobacteria bacterium HGW-Betaproteobacteria-11]